MKLLASLLTAAALAAPVFSAYAAGDANAGKAPQVTGAAYTYNKRRLLTGESITQPSAHLVAGTMYSADGVSFMPNTYDKDLTPEQVDHLAAYLATFK